MTLCELCEVSNEVLEAALMASDESFEKLKDGILELDELWRDMPQEIESNCICQSCVYQVALKNILELLLAGSIRLDQAKEKIYDAKRDLKNGQIMGEIFSMKICLASFKRTQC